MYFVCMFCLIEQVRIGRRLKCNYDNFVRSVNGGSFFSRVRANFLSAIGTFRQYALDVVILVTNAVVGYRV